MRIETLHVDGFGHFHSRDIGPLDSPLTVIYGPNEAGKSTALDFIRTMLFGFPTQSKSGFHAPLSGGRHGGMASIRAEDGRQFLIERRPGAKGGTIRITTESGQVLETDAELRRVLGHANEAMYENVFAFGLGELQTAKSLDGPEVSGQIYNAGLGAAPLPRVLKGLSDGADKLFKPGGANQPAATILKDLESVEAGLRAVQGAAAEYSELTDRLDAIGAELDAATAEIEAHSRREANLEQLRKGWEEWAPLVLLRERRATLPAFPNFPESARTRLESLQKNLRDAKEREREAALEVDSAKGAADSTIPDELMLDDEEAIERIRANRARFDAFLGDLPKPREEALGKRNSLDATLAELGANWDESKVAHFDLSVALVGELDRRRKGLEAAERELRESEAVAEADRRAVTDARGRAERVQFNLEQLATPGRSVDEIAERRAVVRESRTALDELLRARATRQEAEIRAAEAADAAALTARPTTPRVGLGAFIAAAFLLAVLSIGAGVMLGGNSTLLGLAIGVPLLVVAGLTGRSVLLVRPGTAAPDRTHSAGVARALANEETARINLETATQHLLEIPQHPRDLDAVEADLVREQGEHDLREAARTRALEALRDVDDAEKKADESLRSFEERKAALAELTADWGNWLAGLGLPDSIDPMTAERMLDRIRRARELVEDVATTAARVASIEREIRAYREMVTSVADRHGMAVDDVPTSPSTVAAALCRRFDEAARATSERRSAREKFDYCQGQLKLAEATLANARQELQGLLDLAGASDVEDLLKLDAQNAEARDLDQQVQVAEQKLVMLSGPGARLAEFIQKLSATTVEEIVAELTAASDDRADAAATRDRLLDERGAATNRLNALAGDATGSELRARRQVLIEQLKATAREWSTLVVARHLLEQARSKYEAERQPGVLRHAQGFFGTVTGGRYTTLMSRLGTHDVTITGKDGGQKTPDQLSRGTQEQLYLALRFGLIRQFAESAEPVPVIVDDILVNFDPERQARAAEAFAELTKTNQVLVFTCHPETRDLFTKADPATRVIELAS